MKFSSIIFFIIPLFIGTHKYNKTTVIDNTTYFDILNKESIDFNINPNKAFFQNKEITQYLYDHLRKDIQENIITKNPFNHRYNKNNDVFIHMRLGDTIRHSPGLNYYEKAIDMLDNTSYTNVYISSDTPKHNYVKHIIHKYNAKLYIQDEVETIQFGSTCKHIILSHGSFSAVIGWLGFNSNVYYPSYDRIKRFWFGDMFSINGWNSL